MEVKEVFTELQHISGPTSAVEIVDFEKALILQSIQKLNVPIASVTPVAISLIKRDRTIDSGYFFLI